MGGIVSADVCLKKANQPSAISFSHRILGTINFDVPFLGMHPGVVVSGISSLFQPSDSSAYSKQEDPNAASKVLLPIPHGNHELGMSPNNGSLLQHMQSQAKPSQNSLGYFPPNASESASLSQHLSRSSGETPGQLSPLSVPVGDPNYNPRFENDIVLPVRKGWESAMHFITKHAGELTHATKTYVTSHFEFGGTMANYKALHERYKKVRALEDIDDKHSYQSSQGGQMRRVRFANYYTASTGRSHRPQSPKAELRPDSPMRGRRQHLEPESQKLTVDEDATSTRSRSKSPQLSVEDPEGNVVLHVSGEDSPVAEDGNRTQKGNTDYDLNQLDPRAASDQEEELDEQYESAAENPTLDDTQLAIPGNKGEDTALPPIPPEPLAPDPFDASQYSNKDVQKLAEKDYSRKVKAYKRAVKDRERTIADRKKMLEKREKQAKKEREKALKSDKKAAEKAEREKSKQEAAEAKTAGGVSSSGNDELESARSVEPGIPEEKEVKDKPKRERKFCITPSKGPNGERDSAWIRVYMEGVDEVGAHCGIFFEDKPHYVKFVNDVGVKVQEWVEHDNLVREAEGQNVR